MRRRTETKRHGRRLSAAAVLSMALLIAGHTGTVNASAERTENSATSNGNGASRSPSLSHETEVKTMSAASRLPPPQVPPVEIDGIIYAQVLNARKLGLPNACGYLSATDAKTNQQLWVHQVYALNPDEGDEADVQEAYFKSLTRIEDQRELLIENEFGDKYLFNIDTKAATHVP